MKNPYFLVAFFVLSLCACTEASSKRASARLRDHLSKTKKAPEKKFNKKKRKVTNVLPHTGTACNFFVWDFVSASLNTWCRHLCKECAYEGKGGKKHVHVDPNSWLQLLYPCSRYRPDRCIRCGGKFSDHLKLWWSNNLYTPFDLYLDYVSSRGVQRVVYGEDVPMPPRTRYLFHRSYVMDGESVWGGLKKHRERSRALKKAVTENPSLSFPVEIMKPEGERMSYIVPSIKGKEVTSDLPAWVLVRSIVLHELNSLIRSQRVEEHK